MNHMTTDDVEGFVARLAAPADADYLAHRWAERHELRPADRTFFEATYRPSRSSYGGDRRRELSEALRRLRPAGPEFPRSGIPAEAVGAADPAANYARALTLVDHAYRAAVPGDWEPQAWVGFAGNVASALRSTEALGHYPFFVVMEVHAGRLFDTILLREMVAGDIEDIAWLRQRLQGGLTAGLENMAPWAG